MEPANVNTIREINPYIQQLVDAPKTAQEIEVLQKFATRAVREEMSQRKCYYFAGFLVKLQTLWRSPETVKNMILSGKIELNAKNIRWLTPEQIIYLKQEGDKRDPAELLLQQQLNSVQNTLKQAIGNARSEKIQNALALFFRNQDLCENAVQYPLILNERGEHPSYKDKIFFGGLKIEATRFRAAENSLSLTTRELYEKCWMHTLEPDCYIYRALSWTVYRGRFF
jgi:hypothetical protein